jgi:hypothetical protein
MTRFNYSTAPGWDVEGKKKEAHQHRDFDPERDTLRGPVVVQLPHGDNLKATIVV